MENVKLILVAMDEELEALLNVLRYSEIEYTDSSDSDVMLYQFKHKSSQYLVTKSGMGIINASYNLSHLITRWKNDISSVALLGVAGSLNDDLNIGDLVIANYVIQHDYFSSLDDGDYRMLSGDLILSAEQAKNYTFKIESSVSMASELQAKIKNSHIGGIASGSEFVGTTNSKNRISGIDKNLLAVDMEAAAIAAICKRKNIPFIVCKTIADKLNPDGSIENDFQRFLNYASENAAKTLNALLEVK